MVLSSFFACIIPTIILFTASFHACVGKWRIAVEIASSPDHKIDIFHSLKQLCKYQQAQLAYDQMNLAALGIAPVSEEEFLHEKSLDLYVRFPFDKEKVGINNTISFRCIYQFDLNSHRNRL